MWWWGQHGLAAAADGGDVVVLGGAARIGPPYRPVDCRTGNPQARVRVWTYPCARVCVRACACAA